MGEREREKESAGACARNVKGEIGEIYIFPFNTYYVV